MLARGFSGKVSLLNCHCSITLQLGQVVMQVFYVVRQAKHGEGQAGEFWFCSNVLKKRACSSLLMVPKAGDKLLVSRVFENVTCCFI